MLFDIYSALDLRLNFLLLLVLDELPCLEWIHHPDAATAAKDTLLVANETVARSLVLNPPVVCDERRFLACERARGKPTARLDNLSDGILLALTPDSDN